MIPATPDARDRGASPRATFALAIALSALAGACGRERSPAPARPSAPAAVAPETPRAAPASVVASAPAAAPASVAAPAPAPAEVAKPVVAEPQVPVGLAVGNRAPDFEAQDLEGTRFKLSDYRGKVVVLDFWGFW
jgi:hypothetical protein